ncbi:MAG: hypothetical protein K0Q63_629 [Paenibacillus sp.]|nr:hypothetical protein [Paenibacillus sp.]
MPRNTEDNQQQYDRDDITNIHLERHPVYCEFRSGDLRRKRLHFHEGYEVYICLGGSGSYIVEDKLFPLHAGTLTVIGPNVVHHPFSKEDSEFSRYILTIGEPYLASIAALCAGSEETAPPLASLAGGGHYFLSASQLERARSAAAAIAGRLDLAESQRGLSILHRVTELLLLIGELRDDPLSQQSASGSHEGLIREVVAYMTASYREHISIDGLLERFPLSRSQLLHLFKATTGYTVTQFLTEYRLNKAKWLLVDTDLPMTEIAARSGFGDLSHFYHLFRRESGMTPRQYRQRALERRS